MYSNNFKPRHLKFVFYHCLLATGQEHTMSKTIVIVSVTGIQVHSIHADN